MGRFSSNSTLAPRPAQGRAAGFRTDQQDTNERLVPQAQSPLRRQNVPTSVSQLRNDDNAWVMTLIEGALEKEEATRQKIEYPEQKWAKGDIIPIEVSNDPITQVVKYWITKGVGYFRQINNYVTSLPTIDIIGRLVTQQVYKFGAQITLTDDDIEQAALDPAWRVEGEKVATVYEVAEMTINSLIFSGKTTKGEPSGFDGIINHPAITHTMSPYKIGPGQSSAQILALLNDMVQAPGVLSNGVESVDTVCFDIVTHNYISSTPYSENPGSSDSGKSIKAVWLENNPQITKVHVLFELTGAGANGATVMIALKRDPTRIKCRLLQGVTPKKTYIQGLNLHRPYTFRYGGIVVYRPLAVHIVHNV